jgi:hypothetical protein
MAKRASRKTLPVLVRLPLDLAVPLDELRRREFLLESRPGAIRLILRRALYQERAAQMGHSKKDTSDGSSGKHWLGLPASRENVETPRAAWA